LRSDDNSLALDLDVLVEAAVPSGIDRTRLASLARFVLITEGAAGSWVVAVALIDDRRIRMLHREFMDIDEATDVMTFPLDAESGTFGGDIVISVERAAEQGPDFGLSPADEVEFLLVHGLLHLCGWDDAAPADRVRMLERQTELVAAFESGRTRSVEASGN
jgi:rRNA maturation RNase YbeY